MNNTQNEQMDAQVLEIITAKGPVRFGDISKLLGYDSSGGKRVRPVDCAVQRLRRAGKIEFVAGKWAVPQTLTFVDPVRALSVKAPSTEPDREHKKGPEVTKPAEGPAPIPLPHQW